jgi:hypothetical protein
MTVDTYKSYWQGNDEQLYFHVPSQESQRKFDAETLTFLMTYGLPAEVAPFLSFDQIQEPQLKTPGQIFNIEIPIADSCLMFGSNGSGDPICIDMLNHGEIIYLNHDHHFDRIFINENIFKFACCLIKYRDFIQSLIDEVTEEYPNKKFRAEKLEEFKNDLITIDPSCLNEGSFWFDELAILKWEQDNE